MPFPCRSVMLAWISWGRRRNDEETNSEQNAKSRSSGCFLFFFLVRLVHAGLLVFSQRIVLLWKSWPDVMWRWPSTLVCSSAWKWFLDFKFRIHSLHTGLSYCTKSTLYTGLLFFSQRIALVSRFALLDCLLPLASCLLPLASCLLDCLGFAFGPPAVSYKPGSTVNRHSYKSLFLFTFFKSENENANKGDECWNFHQQNWFVVYRGFHVFLSFERLQSLLCVVLDCYFAWKLSSVFVRQLWQNTKFIIMKSGQFAINYWFNISFCFIFLDMWTNPCQRSIAGHVWVWRHR